jgi:hypothetical protein
MSTPYLGWSMSSFLACPRAGGLGAGAGACHRVGDGGPAGVSVHGAPYVNSGTARDNHSQRNVVHWMMRALQMVSLMPLRKDVEK